MLIFQRKNSFNIYKPYGSPLDSKAFFYNSGAVLYIKGDLIKNVAYVFEG